VADPSHVILSFNSGSSSDKFALRRLSTDGEKLLAEGEVEGIGRGNGRLWIRDGGGAMLSDTVRSFSNGAYALDALFDEFSNLTVRLRLPHPDAIGHRLVHGGPHHFAP